MLLHREGRQPSDEFAMVPNAAARDSRLTLRARGLLTVILSHAEGYRLTIERVAEECREGREAVATVFRELEEFGYLRRYRRSGEGGRIEWHVSVYPYGDAPSEAPSAGFQSPVSQSMVDRGTIEDQEENQLIGEISLVEGGEDAGQTSSTRPALTQCQFPAMLKDILISKFGVTDGGVWESAWLTATSTTSTSAIEFDPTGHLAAFLGRCIEQRRQPSASTWLKFYYEDRAKFVHKMREEHQTVSDEDVNQRLARHWRQRNAEEAQVGA